MERIWIPALFSSLFSIHAEIFYYLAQQTKLYNTIYVYNTKFGNIWGEVLLPIVANTLLKTEFIWKQIR